MQDKTIEGGTTVRLGDVSGDLRVGRRATIMAEAGRKVTVAGNARFEGPVTIACDFECKAMRVEGKGFGPSGNVEVKGNLLVHGDAEIDASVDVRGDVTAERVDVGGHLEAKSITAKGVRVGGHMRVKGGLKAEDVDVGGHSTVDGEVDIANLRVGGHAEIGGGKVRGEIKVRGHFLTRGSLSYGDFQVYGHLALPGGSRGERLNALGKVEFEGDAYCRDMEVNGVANVEGSLEAERLKVNGKLDVEGSLKVSEKLQVFGAAEAEKQVVCGAVEVGGRLAADRVVSAGSAEVAGQLWTRLGLKAKEVGVGAGSRVNGPIVGESVEVGKGLVGGGFWEHMSTSHTLGRMTRVDDVHARDVRIERYSQAKKIYAETVRMQSGSMADEVSFTKEADISEGVHLEKSPRKVENLPDAPS